MVLETIHGVQKCFLQILAKKQIAEIQTQNWFDLSFNEFCGPLIKACKVM